MMALRMAMPLRLYYMTIQYLYRIPFPSQLWLGKPPEDEKPSLLRISQIHVIRQPLLVRIRLVLPVRHPQTTGDAEAHGRLVESDRLGGFEKAACVEREDCYPAIHVVYASGSGEKVFTLAGHLDCVASVFVLRSHVCSHQ